MLCSRLATVFFLAHTATASASTSTVIVSAPKSTSSSYTVGSEFQAQTLAVHNTFRSQHNASSLSWNNSLATTASNWANACVWGHSHGPTGENLAAGFLNVTAAITAWGNEQKQYSYLKPGFSEQTGHFTQLVWKGTQSVGCGRKYCNTSTTPGWYVVCEYWPPGNVLDHFIQNVSPQSSDGTGKTAAGRKHTPEGEFGPMVGKSAQTRPSLVLLVVMLCGWAAIAWTCTVPMTSRT